jgi:AcrR family transcriptional regulator
MAPKPSVEEERRREILQAALSCFSRRGYHETTMEEIAAAAKLSKGLIYYYFKNKQELFLALLDSWFAQFDRTWQGALASGSAEEKLQRLAQLSIETIERSTDLMNLLLEFWAHASRDPALMSRFRQALRHYREDLANVIAEGVGEGEFQAVDLQLSAAGLLAAYDGLWFHWMIDPQGVPIRRAGEVLIKNFLEGLKCK